MRRETTRWRKLAVAGLSAGLSLLCGCILLPNDPPVAQFLAAPVSGSVPLTVTFDGSGSYDPDGWIRSYRWAFGDGTTAEGVTATHVYSAPGTYTVRLTVEDQRFATSTASGEVEVRAGTNYAILIGVATYPPPQIPLGYTDDDAWALGERLASLPGWRAQNIQVLTNGQATLGAFRAALDAVAAVAGPDDLLFVGFSGHGTYYVDLNGDEADGFDEALIFYDAPLLDDMMVLWLEEVPVGKLAVSIDACYSGGHLDARSARTAATPKLPGAASVLDDLERGWTRMQKDLGRVPKTLVAMAASRADQVSWEVASLRHGIYTYALLEALDGRADAAGNGNGMTSMEECFAYVSPRVQALALAHAGEVQTPQLLDRAEGELEICGVP